MGMKGNAGLVALGSTTAQSLDCAEISETSQAEAQFEEFVRLRYFAIDIFADDDS